MSQSTIPLSIPLLAAFVFLFPAQAAAQCQPIDFENLPVDTVVNTQYRGLTFSFESVGCPPGRLLVVDYGNSTASPTHALCPEDGPAPCEFNPGFIRIVLDEPVRQLSFMVGGSVHSWATIATGTTPVIDGVLGTWDTRGLAPCAYALRLVVTSSVEVGCRLDHPERYDHVTVIVGDPCGVNCGLCADANCDGMVSVGDINDFVGAVTSGAPCLP